MNAVNARQLENASKYNAVNARERVNARQRVSAAT